MQRPQPATPSVTAPRALVGAVLALALVTLAVFVRAPSAWLRAMTPDGGLEPHTAFFLDSLRWLLLLATVGLALAWASPGVRRALAASWKADPSSASQSLASRWLAPACALAAAILRLAVASQSDFGLGDDGARAAWLASWLQHPHAVWTGMWLPGHLYLQALVALVVGDPSWSGVVLSALGTAGCAWILVRAVERDWGFHAALATGVIIAISPVSLAHGATADINPMFAFFPIAAVAAIERFLNGGGRRWLWIGGALLAWSTWCRFDAIVLVPAVAILLWPRRTMLLVFALGSLLPFVLWNAVESMQTGQAAHVARVVQNDPGLRGSLVSLVFSLLGGVWQAVPLPCAVLGIAGMLRALRARRGRAWMPLALFHAGVLAATTWLLGAGTQPRYFILTGTIVAAYAGIGWAGIIAASRRTGWIVAVVASALLVITPGLFASHHDLWVRRDAHLRALVDAVRGAAAGRDVIWVSEESGYLYWCRVRTPISTYHAMPRADSDARALLEEMRAARAAVACVQDGSQTEERWSRFAAAATPEWDVRPAGARDGYRLYDLVRRGPVPPVEAQ